MTELRIFQDVDAILKLTEGHLQVLANAKGREAIDGYVREHQGGRSPTWTRDRGSPAIKAAPPDWQEFVARGGGAQKAFDALCDTLYENACRVAVIENDAPPRLLKIQHAPGTLH